MGGFAGLIWLLVIFHFHFHFHFDLRAANPDRQSIYCLNVSGAKGSSFIFPVLLVQV